jgi:hypothetical protein
LPGTSGCFYSCAAFNVPEKLAFGNGVRGVVLRCLCLPDRQAR